jgi:putative ABC transport system permease protein
MARQRFATLLLGVFSVVALVIAAIGIYGVMAYNVSRRTTEIGIRLALGAQPRDVLNLVLAQGGKLVGLGLFLGLAAALASGRLLESLLFQTSPHDPLTLAAITLILALVATLACLLPARRATKVDPMVALRAE